MTVLGHITLVLALLSAAGSAFTYFRAVPDRASRIRPGRVLLRSSVAFTVVASLILLVQILQHDFTNAYVYSYSDRSLPLHFLVSTFYAGQEGSFLFWALCSALIALILSRYTGTRKVEPWVMGVYMTIQTVLLLLLVAKTPFQSIWDRFTDMPPAMVPPDGSGLNPLLQNFWMTIHPPVLFVGFAAMAVPYSFAVAALLKRDNVLYRDHSLPWLLFGACALGAGLMLGGYWAYGVLGWGGYWGWDPVENSSLIPWLVAIALIHTLVAQKRTGRYVRLNLLLAVLTFFFVLYSTFLTRSGILGDASVHSFTDPGATVYWLLLAALVVVLGGGLGLLVPRWKELGSPEGAGGLTTREAALGGGALALLLSAAVVLFGTSLPIFSNSSVEPSFYDATNLPIGIVIALLVGWSLFAQWESSDAAGSLRRARISGLVAVAATIVVAALSGLTLPSMILFTLVSFFALAVNIEIGAKTVRGDWRFLGGKIAHAGLAVFFLGVIATGTFSTTERLALPLGQTREALGHTMTYTGYSQLPDGKFAFRIAMEDGEKRYELSPVMFDAGNQGVMRTPDIASFVTRDVYLSPVAVEEQEDTHNHETLTLMRGQSGSLGTASVRFLRFDMAPHGGGMEGGAMTVGAVIEVASPREKEELVPLLVYNRDGKTSHTPVESRIAGGALTLESLQAGMGDQQSSVTISVHRRGDEHGGTQVLIVEASLKPFVNLLWAGTVLMLGGFLLAMFKRARES